MRTLSLGETGCPASQNAGLALPQNWQNLRGGAGKSWIQSIEIQKGKLQERNQQTTEPTIMDLDPATMDPNDSQLVPIQISWDGMG